ncbi:MAG: metallophosphoesterase [Mogibacterium sp.]|nr:metallophosphoesterase [Mogibacterium sp.]
MKILIVADVEQNDLWDHNPVDRERYADVGLILSAGDLRPAYLEYLVTMFNVPLLYVRGNHDNRYDKEPPAGCLNIDGKTVEVACRNRAGEEATLRVAGLGGCMRYKPGSDMYTEKEMSGRVKRLRRSLRKGLCYDIEGQRMQSRAADVRYLLGQNEGLRPDILLTHAPCLGYGDMEDLPHRGFACFNGLLDACRPAYHCYAHVHMEYGHFARVTEHPSGTTLINCSGAYLLDFPQK